MSPARLALLRQLGDGPLTIKPGERFLARDFAFLSNQGLCRLYTTASPPAWRLTGAGRAFLRRERAKATSATPAGDNPGRAHEK